MNDYLKLNEKDSVAVALRDGLAVPMGHKIALKEIKQGEDIIKYGYPIGRATQDISKGEHVHLHNAQTNLGELLEYSYHPSFEKVKPAGEESFMGYLRGDGSAGIRNEVWILNTVGCVNATCRRLEEMANRELLPKYKNKIDGVHTFLHPYGCSQMGEDHRYTQISVSGLAKHPNAGAVLVVGLGCENNHVEALKETLGDYDPQRIKFVVTQDVEDEFEEGMKLLEELMDYASRFERRPLPVSMLKIGLKCGGSDGFSGITANPVVGAFSDLFVARGATTVLTEVPEMFGSETILMDRAVSREVYEKTVSLINDYKLFFKQNGQEIYENPSYGNKKGGITTLEEKSLGCTQKGGASPVMDVLPYGVQASVHGLNLLCAPGNDLVATTGLTLAGCQAILFTTGRGTPLGAPVPTLKIATNTPLALKKSTWIDFDAGRLIDGERMNKLAKQLYDMVMRLCSGEMQAKNELYGFRELGIFKIGATA